MKNNHIQAIVSFHSILFLIFRFNIFQFFSLHKLSSLLTLLCTKIFLFDHQTKISRNIGITQFLNNLLNSLLLNMILLSMDKGLNVKSCNSLLITVRINKIDDSRLNWPVVCFRKNVKLINIVIVTGLIDRWKPLILAFHLSSVLWFPLWYFFLYDHHLHSSWLLASFITWPTLFLVFTSKITFEFKVRLMVVYLLQIKRICRGLYFFLFFLFLYLLLSAFLNFFLHYLILFILKDFFFRDNFLFDF